MFTVQKSAGGLRMRFPASLENIDIACRHARDLLRSIRTGVQDIFEVSLVLREALLNAVIHGSGSDPTMKVQCELGMEPGKIEITVEDEGGGFDWKTRLKRISDPHETGGRGLTILRAYCDSVVFNESGNRVVMRMNLEPVKSPQDPESADVR